ncbi:MAG: FAD-dependent oxidoreductase [Candidatus Eisenbacteria bacterium]|uniref:FAD-dependent oxidoreductase n=1 Tax=Eiseniibacteriota bacterium TaxID=2212470 RepID=A0A956RPD8_UNCEI|nr:FAD-dependent oxidoreductase [Candidatus Eisenbacteria bacterium]
MSLRSSHPPVVVVGGGILGLATAWRLLRAGVRVTLVDPGPQTSATRAAAGMLSPFAELPADPAMASAMATALGGYAHFVEKLAADAGVAVAIDFPGTVLLVPETERVAIGDRLRAAGARVEMLDAGALRSAEPMLSLDGGAILLPDEGHVDPRQLHDALQAAFARLGGRWMHTEAESIVIRERGGVGRPVVETGLGPLEAEVVLDATGTGVARFLDEEQRQRLQPRPVRGEILRLLPPARLSHLVHESGGIYLVPQTDGSILVGATAVEGEPRRVTVGGVQWLLEHATRLAPGLAQAEILEIWSGARPLAGNGAPELVEDASGFVFHALGLYRNGILLAPAWSETLANRITRALDRSGIERPGGLDGSSARSEIEWSER